MGPPIQNNMYVRRARMDKDNKQVLSSGADGIAKLIRLNAVEGKVEDLMQRLDIYYPVAGC